MKLSTAVCRAMEDRSGTAMGREFRLIDRANDRAADEGTIEDALDGVDNFINDETVAAGNTATHDFTTSEAP